MITAKQLLLDQLKSAHDLLEQVMADVTPENLHADPGGKALPVGALYAHLVVSEDSIVNGMLQKKTSLAASEWKDKTGLDKPMTDFSDWANYEVWAKTVQVDLPKLQEFAKAVYNSTEVYIQSLQDEGLDKMIELGDWGTYTLAQVLTGFVIGHTCSLAGEISAVKGVHGAKGYPF